MAWFDFLNQANSKGQDAGSIARQRLNARAGIPPRVPSAQPPAMRGGTGIGAGLTFGSLLAPLAVGAGNYLRSPQGQLMKDRLRQGDIPGLFTAITGIGRNNAPQLTQFNPPGFDPSKPISSADILQSAKEVGRTRPPILPAPPLLPAPPVLPQISPEERAYNEERSRIAQLTAQNPEFQNIDQLRNDLRDQGMAIWAAKYGGPDGLASKVKPGQSGYDAIQRSLYNQGALPVPTLEQLPEGVPTLGPSRLVPQVDPTLNPAGPNYLGGEGPPLMNFADPRFENISPEDFQKLLNQVNKK